MLVVMLRRVDAAGDTAMLRETFDMARMCDTRSARERAAIVEKAGKDSVMARCGVSAARAHMPAGRMLQRGAVRTAEARRRAKVTGAERATDEEYSGARSVLCRQVFKRMRRAQARVRHARQICARRVVKMRNARGVRLPRVIIVTARRAAIRVTRRE